MGKKVAFATTNWKGRPNKPSGKTQAEWDAKSSSGFSGFPMRIVSYQENGDPIELYDGSSDIPFSDFNDLSLDAPKFYGPGTDYPIGFTIDELVKLVWRIKKLQIDVNCAFTDNLSYQIDDSDSGCRYVVDQSPPVNCSLSSSLLSSQEIYDLNFAGFYDSNYNYYDMYSDKCEHNDLIDNHNEEINIFSPDSRFLHNTFLGVIRPIALDSSSIPISETYNSNCLAENEFLTTSNSGGFTRLVAQDCEGSPGPLPIKWVSYRWVYHEIFFRLHKEKPIVKPVGSELLYPNIHFSIGLSASIVPYQSYDRTTCTITNRKGTVVIAPNYRVGTGYVPTNSGSILDKSFPMYKNLETESIDGSVQYELYGTLPSLSNFSLSISAKEYWEYDDGNGNPIYDTSTGAQLRDPITG